MGYMRHHAIVVTSRSKEGLEEAQKEALRVFADMRVSYLTPAMVNGYRSFFIAPDGSKEWWPYSDRGDRQRAEFVRWLCEQVYGDGSSDLSWVEVQFGDDERETKVISSSDDWQKAQGRGEQERP